MPAQPSPSDAIMLVVVGAHMTGMPLNHELQALGAAFVRKAATRPVYRLYELAGTKPAKPGLLRVEEGEGAAIEVELWSLDAAGFGVFVSHIPPPLGIGTIALEDGSWEKGFLVEAIGIRGARDITEFGGWRSYKLNSAPDS